MLLPTVAVFVALLSSLFHGEQTSAAGFPAPSFAATRAFDAGAGPRAVTPGDFNGDGKPDLAVANSTGIAVLLGEGDGAFQTAINTGAGPSPESLAVGDFNADGKPDYVLYSSTTRRTAIWYLNNNFYVSAAYGPTLPVGWSLVAP